MRNSEGTVVTGQPKTPQTLVSGYKAVAWQQPTSQGRYEPGKNVPLSPRGRLGD